MLGVCLCLARFFFNGMKILFVNLLLLQRVAAREGLAGPRPHILLITTDQQRLESVGAYGEGKGAIPN